MQFSSERHLSYSTSKLSFWNLVQDNNNNFKSNFIDWLKNLTSKFSKSSSFLPYCISQTCHWYWNFDRLGSCCKTRCHVWTNARIKVMTVVSSLVKLQKTMKLKCIGQETTFHKFHIWHYVWKLYSKSINGFDFVCSSTIPDCTHFKQTTCLSNNLRCTRRGCILFNSDMQGINLMQEVISIYFYSYKE